MALSVFSRCLWSSGQNRKALVIVFANCRKPTFTTRLALRDKRPLSWTEVWSGLTSVRISHLLVLKYTTQVSAYDRLTWMYLAARSIPWNSKDWVWHKDDREGISAACEGF